MRSPAMPTLAEYALPQRTDCTTPVLKVSSNPLFRSLAPLRTLQSCRGIKTRTRAGDKIPRQAPSQAAAPSLGLHRAPEQRMSKFARTAAVKAPDEESLQGERSPSV